MQRRTRRTFLGIAILATVLMLGVMPNASAEDGDRSPGLTAPNGRSLTVDDRIVGGTVASLGEYPYQALVFPGPFLCGGSVIHPRWILTAAHCMFDGGTTPFDPDEILVVTGTNSLSSGGDEIVPDDVIVHPSYPPLSDGGANDIALLHLPREVHQSFVPMARTGQEAAWAPGTNATVTGWGTTSQGGSVSSVLREVAVPVTTDPYCTGAYGGDFVAAAMICAGLDAGGKDSCQGDSGGPLAVSANDQWLQMGIVSWGFGCALPSYPGVYTRLANYYTWVRGHVGGPPNDNFGSAETPPCAVSFDTEANQFASMEGSEPNAEGASLWYRYTPATSGTLWVNTLGSDFDTVLRIYTGAAIGSLVQVGVNDDIISGEERSALAILVTGGTTYRIQIEGKENSATIGAQRGPARVNISFDPNTGQQFPDVVASNPFFEDIAWMGNNGITSGFGGCLFKPAASVTRQSMAAFLYRMDFWDRAFHDDPGFDDVFPGDQFYKEIAWMVDEGIAAGFPDGGYHPNDPVTRQSMAAFLYRMAGSPNGDNPTCSSAPFSDVPTSNPFCGEIKWMTDEGIANGYPDGSFKPTNNISRQAMAAFTHNFVTS